MKGEKITGTNRKNKLPGKRSRSLAGAGLLVLFLFLGSIPAFGQAGGWGFDDEGKALVAVLPLAGAETAEMAEMVRRLYLGTVEAVAALGNYNPRQIQLETVFASEPKIPTDLPPHPDLTAGARYALTGGVYPGGIDGEFYLQLWLWDMAGSMMIYTDDLIYEKTDNALQTLPGLVEWLFSHIHAVSSETPGILSPWDPLFMVGLRAGLSQRWYTDSNGRSPGAWALLPEGSVYAALRLNSLFTLQLELLFGADAVVYRGLNLTGGTYFLANKKFTSYSLMIPLLLKVNFRTGPVILSPLAGLYGVLPLGKTRFKTNTGDEASYKYSYSLPLGFTAGFEAAIKYGPGRLSAGLRYAVDFGEAIIDNDLRYRRHILSLYLGYEFGFFNGKKLRGFQ
ncbi:MAG: outer membrane beta-barrel protein [Treponema sp.]|jgi:hypothetical protein|nr:outer membrane beta-barrel protein [Treponema sp.]